ncbi:hypothetical protein RDABS01_030078 [Bienertia sinuspersici]
MMPKMKWVYFTLMVAFVVMKWHLGMVMAISGCQRTPIMFSFGDSNSDTGGLVSGLGYQINPPYGRSFFGRSTGRLSDGRLILDFLCQSLNARLLSPYMDSLESNFQNGGEFCSGRINYTPSISAICLKCSSHAISHFKRRSLELAATGAKGFINEEGFRNALYMIDIGQNDLADSFSKNLSYARVVRRIPLVVAEIKKAMKALYDQGGRNFWVQNTGPLGCLPQKTLVSPTQSRRSRCIRMHLKLQLCCTEV